MYICVYMYVFRISIFLEFHISVNMELQKYGDFGDMEIQEILNMYIVIDR